MSETTIFLTKTDFVKLADFIFRNYKATFVPDVNFHKPDSIELKNVEELVIHLHQYPHERATALSYLINSPIWSIEPIYFVPVENPIIGNHYSAIQRYGGPSIYLTPRMHGLPNSPADKIIGGMLADYSYYISGSFINDKTNGYKTIERPEALKQALSDIKKFIKSNGQRVVYRNGSTRIAYAMTGAYELYEKGVKLMQGNLSFEKE
ncbi:MAG: hypothetical protein J7502_01005 [Flavisolibacter sp.]|nr:hypothetical protein [Flavisolibacter sp.]